MQKHELEKYTDFLLSAALYKCKNLEDAQDLTQDTLLEAVTYLFAGKEIHDIKGWLLTVLNRKFYNKLRQKYKIPLTCIDSETDIADETCFIDNIIKNDEAEEIRRSVAYLAKLYREVIVRHYINGESVEKISRDLSVPQGTVKSRLSAGREKLKKEFYDMESYTKQSYEPIRMEISNSGNSSINGEPGSLVTGDLIAQNLLFLAYNEPVSEVDLAKAIGVPTVYIEPIINRLVDGELMKRTGNKVYSDFLITTIEDKEKYIPAQKQLVSDNSDLFLRAIKKGLLKVRAEKYYKRFNENQRNALELFYMFRCLDVALYRAFSNIYNATQIFPDRPNGGKWIAFGHVTTQNFNYKEHIEIFKHQYAGERWTYLDNYLGAKSIGFHVFDPNGFPIKVYYQTCQGINDAELLRLLHIIESGIDPNETGFNIELLKSIPWLVKCKILRYDGDTGKAAVDIPVLSPDEFNSFIEINTITQNELISDITALLTEYLKGKKQVIPAHLTSVPLQKQYLTALGALDMATIRLAITDGVIHDGGYDNDDGMHDNQCPYPMVYIVSR